MGFLAGEILVPRLPLFSLRIHVIAAGWILFGIDTRQHNHGPVTGFLLAKQGRKDLIITAEGNAHGAVADKVDATAGSRKRYGGRAGIGGCGVFREFRPHVFFQITGTAEHSQVHGLQLRIFPQGLGNGIALQREGNVHPSFRSVHGRALRLRLTGAGKQAQQGNKQYDKHFSHRGISPQIK